MNKTKHLFNVTETSNEKPLRLKIPVDGHGVEQIISAKVTSIPENFQMDFTAYLTYLLFNRLRQSLKCAKALHVRFKVSACHQVSCTNQVFPENQRHFTKP